VRSVCVSRGFDKAWAVEVLEAVSVEEVPKPQLVLCCLLSIARDMLLCCLERAPSSTTTVELNCNN